MLNLSRTNLCLHSHTSKPEIRKFFLSTADNLLSKHNISSKTKLVSKYFYSNDTKSSGENDKEKSTLLSKITLPAFSTSQIRRQSEDWSELWARWYKQYQDFVGMTEIYEAQNNVTKLTNNLLEAQVERRKYQLDVDSTHQQLLTVHQRITKSELYSEDHFSLFEKARILNASLKDLQTLFASSEEKERLIFTKLSNAIKYCHEKERTQADQSKYWSLLISMISAVIASLITSINNWVRIREIKEHSTTLHNDALNKYDTLETKILTSVQSVFNKNDLKLSDFESSFESDIIPSIKSTMQDGLDRIVLHVNKNNIDSGGVDMDEKSSFVKENSKVLAAMGVIFCGAALISYFSVPGS